MPTVTHVARIDHEISQRDDAFYVFLAENERRSGSLRTVSHLHGCSITSGVGLARPLMR